MKRLLWTLTLLVPALAQPLPEALKKAPEVAAVVTARLEYEMRQKDLSRTLQDPLRTPLAELQARQAEALAKARLERALAQAESDIVSAYAQAREASLQVALAAKALEVAELGLRAAEVRVKGGGATSLDLLEAQNRVLEARKNLEAAKRGEESALAALANLVGSWKPEAVAELPPLPQKSLVEELLQAHADLLNLRQSLALLRFQRGLLDESFTPRKDMEALEDQAKTLEENLHNLERSLRVGLEARFGQLSPLLQGVRTAEEAYRAANERYQAEEKRFQAGLTSRLGLLQQELALLQAALSLEQAKHAYLKAYYGLLASR
ncbi:MULTISPECIES: TolC family protein [Thermus]|jgi:outer membrane protein TolC|uniref:Outer membrane efflux protein n=1 Tax=Thermus brockianus TaxID=56956 RepID=A0A1J0LQC8_THEBO|nr:TolC family protein [Thermus brockianus]APD08521.1 Outer membrane efflux protein [Thermus brockianus]BDG16126.1 transporter [Thermus brockianus]